MKKFIYTKLLFQLSWLVLIVLFVLVGYLSDLLKQQKKLYKNLENKCLNKQIYIN